MTVDLKISLMAVMVHAILIRQMTTPNVCDVAFVETGSGAPEPSQTVGDGGLAVSGSSRVLRENCVYVGFVSVLPETEGQTYPKVLSVSVSAVTFRAVSKGIGLVSSHAIPIVESEVAAYVATKHGLCVAGTGLSLTPKGRANLGQVGIRFVLVRFKGAGLEAIFGPADLRVKAHKGTKGIRVGLVVSGGNFPITTAAARYFAIAPA